VVAPQGGVREGAIAHAVNGRLVGRITSVKGVPVHVEPAPGAGVRETPA
jgi:hypothetical protein